MARPEAEMACVCRDPEPTPTRPIVLGGQGRSGPAVEGCAIIVCVCLGIAALMVLATWLVLR